MFQLQFHFGRGQLISFHKFFLPDFLYVINQLPNRRAYQLVTELIYENTYLKKLKEPVQENIIENIIPEENVQEETIEIPIIENLEENTSIIEPIQDPIKNDKSKKYLDTVNDFINTKKITPIIKQEKISKMPVYKYSKKVDGTVNIESKNNDIKEDVKKVVTDTNEIKKQEIIKLLEDVNKNIIKNQIEIDIHIELLRSVSNEKQKNLYEQKLEAYQRDLEYLIKRRDILERM
jgi:hypothetical protein